MSSLSVVCIEWRSGFNTIGFVLFFDNVIQKQKARFDRVPGMSAEDDVEHIRDYGTKMSYEEAKGFFGDCLLPPDKFTV